MSLQDPVVLFRRGDPAAAGSPRTLIVLGPARGGTTMIAQMLDDLGVFMGQGLDSTCQDPVMNEISRALFDGRIDIEHPVVEQVLRQRDREFVVWGWKFPTQIFEPLYAKARNPHLICVFRDPVAIATRESVSHGYNVEACFGRALDQTAKLGGFLLSAPYPALGVSYERGLARKAELVDALAEFAGIAASGAVRQLAAERAQPGTSAYLHATRGLDIEGNIDDVGTHVAGWVRYPHQRERRARFTLLVDNVPVYEGIADHFREDLRAAFDNDGCCAFSVPLPELLIDGRPHKISLRVPDGRQCRIDNNDREWTLAGR